jgi:hypothetical protein
MVPKKRKLPELAPETLIRRIDISSPLFAEGDVPVVDLCEYAVKLPPETLQYWELFLERGEGNIYHIAYDGSEIYTESRDLWMYWNESDIPQWEAALGFTSEQRMVVFRAKPPNDDTNASSENSSSGMEDEEDIFPGLPPLETDSFTLDVGLKYFNLESLPSERLNLFEVGHSFLIVNQQAFFTTNLDNSFFLAEAPSTDVEANNYTSDLPAAESGE